MSDINLWEDILSTLEVCGHEAHWLHVPSHIGIKGNHKADRLVDVGRCKSPLLLGNISVNMVGRVEEQEEERPNCDEQSLLGMEGEGEPEEEEDTRAPLNPLASVRETVCTPI